MRLKDTFSQVVPEAHANKNPWGEEREAPCPLGEPTTRVSWDSMFKNPVGLFQAVMGPKRMVGCCWGCACLTIVILAIVFFMVMYYLTEIFPFLKIGGRRLQVADGMQVGMPGPNGELLLQDRAGGPLEGYQAGGMPQLAGGSSLAGVAYAWLFGGGSAVQQGGF